MLPDTRVSSQQTEKQQEHAEQGVAQMVMNMETKHTESPARASSPCLGVF